MTLQSVTLLPQILGKLLFAKFNFVNKSSQKLYHQYHAAQYNQSNIYQREDGRFQVSPVALRGDI